MEIDTGNRDHAVVTLVEGDFLCGAAALYNSLVKGGFDGHFIIGYREGGSLPEALFHAMQRSGESPPIHFIPLATSWHFTNYKAKFLADIFAGNPGLERLAYLDPDIVIRCPWRWIQSWSDHGPALCADVNWMLPPLHPTRHEWRRLLHSADLDLHQSLHVYFNGGFLGLHRNDAVFAQRWHFLIETLGGRDNPLDGHGDIGKWRDGGRWMALQTPDQDALNLTAVSWEDTLSVLGPDAMGFASGNIFLPHALGSNKPWRKAYLRDALLGRPPRMVDKVFWDNTRDPLRIFPEAVVRRKSRALRAAAAIGRFLRRAD